MSINIIYNEESEKSYLRFLNLYIWPDGELVFFSGYVQYFEKRL